MHVHWSKKICWENAFSSLHDAGKTNRRFPNFASMLEAQMPSNKALHTTIREDPRLLFLRPAQAANAKESKRPRERTRHAALCGTDPRQTSSRCCEEAHPTSVASYGTSEPLEHEQTKQHLELHQTKDVGCSPLVIMLLFVPVQSLRCCSSLQQ